MDGKGVTSTMWDKIAEEGYQLVYGATADHFAQPGPVKSSRRGAIRDAIIHVLAQTDSDLRVKDVHADAEQLLR